MPVNRAINAKDVQELRDIYPSELMEKMHKVGLRHLCVPVEYGSGGTGRCVSVIRALAVEQASYSMEKISRILGLL